MILAHEQAFLKAKKEFESMIDLAKQAATNGVRASAENGVSLKKRSIFVKVFIGHPFNNGYKTVCHKHYRNFQDGLVLSAVPPVCGRKGVVPGKDWQKSRGIQGK